MASSQRHSETFGILTSDSFSAEWVDAAVTAEQGATCAGSYYKQNDPWKDKDLARPDPRLDGCVRASEMWVSYPGIEANSGMACPYSGSFPHKVGNLLFPKSSSCQTVPRKIEGCSGASPAWEDSRSLLMEDIA